MAIRHNAYLQQKDNKLQEAMSDLEQRITNLGRTVNANPQGATAAPAPPSSVSVTAASGVFTARITDSDATQGKAYLLEYDDNPQFSSPIMVDLGISKSWRANLGTQRLYFRVSSTFYTSKSSTPVYFGAQGSPTVVQG